MSFKKVVVLGAGPLGLMAAIDARQHFVRNVTLVEKRGAYTRPNVPVLDKSTITHLQSIKATPSSWRSGKAGDPIAFSKIEDALLTRAKALGIKLERGWIAERISGRDKNDHGRYKSMTLTLRACDEKGRKMTIGGALKVIEADFLVVSVGGGAAADPLITNILGFAFQKLAPKDYGAYGIFNPEKASLTSDANQLQRKNEAQKLANGVIGKKTPIPTEDHNYLLATLRNCSAADFQRLQAAPADLRKILLTVGQTTSILSSLKQVEKNVAVFEISVQRATQFYSQQYPAVLLGDAAVTPHPEQGSGVAAGYVGLEKLRQLFQELKKLDRSDDTESSFSNFNSQMDIVTSKKALEGTLAILTNNIQNLRNYIARVRQQQNTLSYPQAKRYLGEFAERLQTLQSNMESHKVETEKLLGSFNEPDLSKIGAALGKLWSSIKNSHDEIQGLIGQTDLMSENIENIRRSRFGT
ncbi:hypothetical protein [Granulicella sp. dw_53]|uniref:FAD-dependent oxidoreductase n=1 Tax=Granulicella sp. dw_53 TaxID=2719792 RepID=UPI001BD6D3AE|nr:hypothetical protein [Granulicella sp. dw_53]